MTFYFWLLVEMSNKKYGISSGSQLCDPHSFSVPVEGKKHSRQTLLLAVFTLVWAWALAQQSRAGGDLQVERVARPSAIGMSIEKGSHLR